MAGRPSIASRTRPQETTPRDSALRCRQANEMAAPDIPHDTAPQAYEIQRRIYARLGGIERVAIAFRLTETVRKIAIAGIRSRHPEYGDDDVFRAWARLRLGDDLTR